ncbi:MAG: HNH endonuclease [Ectothiorhodospiraceae bacterium]|nr:HNH endonuclease [Chromatiales bacterium]MCP5157399.1 HNH endonuclease [Ectothiorhodospiraceae bacterium]
MAGIVPFHDAITGVNEQPRPLILRLDVTGQPVRWIPWQSAAILDSRAMIAWHAGDHEFRIYGGRRRDTGLRSSITINSIIAVKGRLRAAESQSAVPPLSNRELYRRDDHMCMYCGEKMVESLLTRDHVLPLSRGGTDTWSNVVTACRPCNHAKGARRPEEAGMALLAVPYVPNRAEYLVLSNRRILMDQMAFLQRRFRNGSPLHHAPTWERLRSAAPGDATAR